MESGTKEQVAALRAYQKKQKAWRHVANLLTYDAATTMPPGAARAMGDTMGMVSGELHRISTDPAYSALVKELYARRETLDLQTRREVEELRLRQERMARIPQDEVIAMEEAESLAACAWETARTENDFAIFAPHLENLIAMKKQYARRIRPDGDVYDTLLDEEEREMTRAKLDPLFDTLRRELTPLLRATGRAAQPDMSFLAGPFAAKDQRALSEFVMDVMGIDRARCSLGETEHPFTIGFSKYDVRITTKYVEDDLTSNLYSIVHEGGHAMYELAIDDRLCHSVLGCGAGTGMQEASARLWENCIGHSLPFCRAIVPQIRALFPAQMADVTAEDLYRAVNGRRNSVMRIDADELAYSLHVMVRYELEKQLFDGTLAVRQLPAAWNQMYREYLGIEVPDDARGALQDAHWASGAFGYFPGYALGNAYAAQLYGALQAAVDLEACGTKGDFSPAGRWLTEAVYRHGMLYSAEELIEKACGKPFDPTCYTAYLREKYTALYRLP